MTARPDGLVHLLVDVRRDGPSRVLTPRCGKTLARRTVHEPLDGQGATAWRSEVTCPDCLPTKEPA